MADKNSWNNMSQSEKEGLINSMHRVAGESDSSGFVNVTGDTMTGDLTLPNLTATGQIVGIGMALTSLASIKSTLNVGDTLTANSGVTLNPVLVAQQTVLGGATIAPIRVIASTASQAFFDFRGAVISTASLNLAANQLAGMIKVWVSGEGGNTIGYMPIFKGVV